MRFQLERCWCLPRCSSRSFVGAVVEAVAGVGFFVAAVVGAVAGAVPIVADPIRAVVGSLVGAVVVLPRHHGRGTAKGRFGALAYRVPQYWHNYANSLLRHPQNNYEPVHRVVVDRAQIIDFISTTSTINGEQMMMVRMTILTTTFISYVESLEITTTASPSDGRHRHCNGT